MIVLRDPRPGKNRWNQAFDWFITWAGLNVIFTKVLFGWLLDAPIWALWASASTCLVVALATEVFTTSSQRESLRAWPLPNESSSSNSDGAAVKYHSHERS